MRFLQTPPAHDLTYSDVFLVPGRSDVVSRLDVSIAPTDGTAASIPLIASNMNSVTGAAMAAAMARRGGLGVLPQDLPLQELDAAIRQVKEASVAWQAPITMNPEQSVRDALARVPATAGHGVVVVDADGELIGSIDALELGAALRDARLGDIVHSTAHPGIDADDVTDGRTAFDLMVAAGTEFAPVLRHGAVVGTLSRTGALRSTIYAPHVDGDGRLAVAAAVGINGDLEAKARALVAAGVDILVLDTAHGHQERMVRAISTVAGLGLGVPIVAGNVVTPEAVADFATAGANIVKVGVGPGAMCTTRMMTAVGRPQ
ncbi:MAG TPA: IMP dehydrogenase, partial [Terrimesophilobacter sp.]|nr:IMP dehydrogenase [Terrimesophilobacter sp.]